MFNYIFLIAPVTLIAVVVVVCVVMAILAIIVIVVITVAVLVVKRKGKWLMFNEVLLLHIIIIKINTL